MHETQGPSATCPALGGLNVTAKPRHQASCCPAPWKLTGRGRSWTCHQHHTSLSPRGSDADRLHEATWSFTALPGMSIRPGLGVQLLRPVHLLALRWCK